MDSFEVIVMTITTEMMKMLQKKFTKSCGCCHTTTSQCKYTKQCGELKSWCFAGTLDGDDDDDDEEVI